MKWRLVLGGLLLALFLTPQLPPVRDALLRYGVAALARYGYDVSYQRSAGNPLYNLKLTGLTATGPGLNASVDLLSVGYTLPALLTGTLPLRAEVSGVEGTVDLDKLALPTAQPAAPAEPARRPLRVRPVLRRAELSDVTLDVRGAPADLPDLKVTTAEVRGDGGALTFDTALSVRDAVAELSGRATLAPFRVDATIQRADVALAETFFEGAKGGTLSGAVRVDGEGVRADLELEDGQVDLVGIDIGGVSGPVRVRGGEITTDLTGRALGGPVSGSGSVDLGARRWQADVTGRAELADALTWLGQGRLSPDVVAALGPGGGADVSLRAGGWQRFSLSGTAAGAGGLLGEPLTDLGVDFGYETDVGTTVAARAKLGGAPLSFKLTPQAGGFEVAADGTDLPLHGFSGDVALDLTQQRGDLTGTAAADLSGTALGRAVRLSADAATVGEAWQLDLSGRDERGARASGTFRLRDGPTSTLVEGAARVRGLELPTLERPINLSVLADGPLRELPLTLRLSGPEGVRVAAGGVRAEADFSGAATATLEGGNLSELRGDFGPLALSGGLDRLHYTLAPTELSGRASGTVALREGRLRREEGTLETTATLLTNGLRGAGVTLPDLNADASLTLEGGLSASVVDPDAGVNVTLRGGELTGSLENTRVSALGDPFTVTGDVSGRAARLTETLALDLRAETPGGGPGTALNVVGDAGRARLSLESDAGATLAGRTLGRALTLSGDASLSGRSAALSGTLGGVGVEVTAQPDASGRVRTRTGLSAGGDEFSADFENLNRWSTEGTLPLAELGDALGLPLTGTLRTTLARRGERFSGEATVAGRAFGLPLVADAMTRGDALNVEATVPLLGQALTLSGQALPEADATLSLGDYGSVRLSGTYPALRVTGAGRVPGVTRAGLSVDPQRWRVSGNLGAGRARLEVGGSVVEATRNENGWQLAARVRQDAQWRGRPLALRADLTRGPQNPDGRVQGTLVLDGSPLTLAGTLRDLSVSGTLPAGALQTGLRGQLGLNLSANIFTQRYNLTSRWRRPDGSRALEVTADGRRGEVTASARAEGLSARFSTVGAPTWRVSADGFALSELPVQQLQNLDARLDGTLARQDGFRGRLRLTSDVGTAQLTGSGKRLRVAAEVARGALRANLAGPVLPTLGVSVQAEAGDAARLSGSLTGSVTEPSLTATLRTAAQSLGGGQLSVPARRFALKAALREGLSASLTGEGTDVRLQGGRWRGELALPFTLRGEPHRLTGTLTGRPTEPVLAADLRGPTVQGPLTLSRGGLSGTLTATPEALPDARVRVSLNATPDRRWRVELAGTATLPYRALPTRLRGTVTGEGVRYRGEGTLNVAGERVPLTLSGHAGSVQARVAAREVALSPFVPATGSVSGDVRLEVNGSVRYFADLSATGTAAGRPFDLDVSADRAAGLSVSGSAAGAKLSLTGPLPLATLDLTLADSQEPLEFSAALTLGRTFTLRGGGGWRGEALSVAGAYTPAVSNGNLALGLGDAALTATVQGTESGRTVTASLAAPTGLLALETPLRADARVKQEGAALTVETLDARVGANTLTLAGAVRPQADVSGELNVPAAGESVALRLTSLETGYLAALTQGTLELRSVLKPTFVPERARLVGTLSRPEGTLDSNLVWQEGAGFSGRADLTLGPTEAASATLALFGETGAGETGLRVRGGAHYRGVRVARLEARLSPEPWRDRRLAGTFTLDAPVGRILPAWPGDPLRVTGTLDLSGDLTAPLLSGPVALRGALMAAGRVRADRGGAALTLGGDGLSVSAAADSSGARGTLSLNALDVSGLAPQLPAPTLSGVLRATQTWGDAPRVQVSDVRLTGGRSRVGGRARLSDKGSGALELDVYLGDVNPALRGRLVGLATVQPGGTLHGTLTLMGLGPEAADWRLGGRVTLSGSPTDPALRVALTGAGTASGTVRGRIAPRQGRLELSSDLALAGIETDLTLTRTRLGVSAAGTLAYRAFGATLRTEGERVLLAGNGWLRGWRGVYGPERFSLQGPLSGLQEQLSGRLALGGPSDLSALSGTLTDAAFGPATLGDVALNVRSGQLRLRGDALTADVGLSGALPWRLQKLSVTLPGDARLTASGEGTRVRGAASGTLRAATLTMPVAARYTPEGLALTADGTTPVGTLEGRARYRGDAWQGYVNVTEESREVVRSTLSGTLAAPTLQGRFNVAEGEITARGTFALGRTAARLEARLLSPRLSAPLSITGAGWPLNLRLATPESALRLSLEGGTIRPNGALRLGVGPTELALRAAEDGLRLLVSVPAAPGLALRTTLPRSLGAYAALPEGVRFTGVRRTDGTLTLRLRPTPGFEADTLRWRGPAGTVSLTGSGGFGDTLSGTVRGRWRGAAGTASPRWLRDVPFTAQADGGRFSVTSNALGRADVRFGAAGRLEVRSALTLGRGRVGVDAAYTRTDGPTGSVSVASVPVFSLGEDLATLSTELALSPGGVSGTGTLALSGGEASLSGRAGWARLLPAPLRRLTPEGDETLSAEVRLDRFELGSVPPVQARAPYLVAPVSGVATVTGAQVVGQIVAPELRVLETALPTQLEFNGNLRALEGRASVADSRLNLRYSRGAVGGRLAGLVTLEGFPLQTLAEAVVGASGVEAPTTGAARFDIPLRRPNEGYVRLATERFTLTSTDAEGGGGTTRGEVALRFENGSLYVERAEFRGEGFWRASGILTPAELDFTLEADNADFTPLLRLAPPLAAFGVGARGSLDLRAAGSASAPDVTLTSPRLEVSVAGGRYRANNTRASLSGGAFALTSDVVGVSPITGRLELRGGGQVNLAPFVTSGLNLRFSGAAKVPAVGAVSAIEGRIYPSPTGWRLDGSGVLGRPFAVSGRLAPLDLTLTGRGLNVQSRPLFVASSSTDLRLGVRSRAGGFDVSGNAFVRQAQLSLDRNGAAGTDTPETDTPEMGSPVDNAADRLPDGSAVASVGSALQRTPNPVLERVRFDSVRLRAPQEVVFNEAFGNAELGLDLTLTGTAATPRLDGQARTLRGSIRFAGEDFTLTQAVATFDPAQGVYPTLELEALATFDQGRALGNLDDRYTFVEPAGPSFETRLSVTGGFEGSGGGRRVLNLEPTLTSNALVQETVPEVGAGVPRPLNEAELVSLLTLGRLQLDAPITGSNSLAGTVAESALDTAVDLLLVSELQDALGEALGVDLIEIRTSALSTILGADGQDQTFGVSLKVGGYLNENLFASVQVGRFNDPEQNYALSNEFSLRYNAAPLELNFTGGVNFLGQSTFTAVTDFALGLSYAVTPLISLDASLETTALGGDASVGFGVSFTW